MAPWSAFAKTRSANFGTPATDGDNSTVDSTPDLANFLHELGSNAGLIAFLVVIFHALTHASTATLAPQRRMRPYKLALLGVCFGLGTWLAMSSPLPLQKGVLVDAKTVVLGLAGAYLPLPSAAIAAAIALAYRAYLGGFGMEAGMLAMAGATVVGYAFKLGKTAVVARLGTLGWLLGLGGALAGLGIALLLVLPTPLRWTLLAQLWLPVSVMFPLGVLVFGALFEGVVHLQRREEELRIAAIAFESQEGMFVADAQWRILRVNRAFEAITGYSLQQALGQQPATLLGSGRHNAYFYAEMAQQVRTHGTWQGEVWDQHISGREYPVWLIITAVKGDEGSLTHYVATMTDITQRKASEAQIAKLAFYDALTQLPNRRLLMDRLAQAQLVGLRNGRKGALLFIDLDNFKSLNDTQGHDKGDALLQQVALRLRATVREADTVARLGGDEFVVMLEDLSEDRLEAANAAEMVGVKVLAALNHEYVLGELVHRSTPSVGVTLFGEQAESTDEPLKRADLAMYQAKTAGRNTLRFFDPQMQAAVTARVAMEQGLREAFAQGQFVLFYQPQVNVDGRVFGAEALVRWQHPERGLVPPGEFIGLAEETGQILALGHWVLETACWQLTYWAQQADMAHLSVAVNVTARQLQQRDFVEQVLAVLARTGAKPYRLKLELTESLLVTSVEDAIAKMAALKARGVGFSLDDFGTGYSSLAYLKRLPLEQLKIDQSFVRDILDDPNDAAIAKMVIALAENLGLNVIAEGVETPTQRAFLQAQGCMNYQGYLFSRPIPVSDFDAYVRSCVPA
ncbi:EAL domain-containing protein [Rhodoferax sediminis]|uniref:EAL domain-containing protein n=1 Tax=Rhodoferax aquaticus TaxID=2527691 RepID=A0A515EV94_9BURK|nr:EAL domain-containing protein [Rhodoferax aquaticus]